MLQLLTDWTGKEVLIVDKVQPEIIGGLIVQLGDERIDTSVATQLRRFHDTMLEHAAQHIHAGSKMFESAIEF